MLCAGTTHELPVGYPDTLLQPDLAICVPTAPCRHCSCWPCRTPTAATCSWQARPARALPRPCCSACRRSALPATTRRRLQMQQPRDQQTTRPALDPSTSHHQQLTALQTAAMRETAVALGSPTCSWQWGAPPGPRWQRWQQRSRGQQQAPGSPQAAAPAGTRRSGPCCWSSCRWQR